MGATQLVDRPVGQVLHPGLQLRHPGQLMGGVPVECGRRARRPLAGGDPLGHRAQFGLDRQELRPAPLIGLLDVDDRAEEIARGQFVALTAHRVLLRRPSAQVGAQEVGEIGVGLVGRRRGGGQLPGRRFRHDCRARGQLPGEATEEPAVGRPTRVHVALLGAPVDLPDGGDPAVVGGLPQALPVAEQRGRDGGHSPGDGPDVGDGVGGHQVEDLAHQLQRRGDHVQVRVRPSGQVPVAIHLEPLGEHLAGYVVRGSGGGQFGQSARGRRGELVPVRQAGGRQVVQPVLIDRQADVRRDDRPAARVLGHVGVRQFGDRRSGPRSGRRGGP